MPKRQIMRGIRFDAAVRLRKLAFNSTFYISLFCRSCAGRALLYFRTKATDFWPRVGRRRPQRFKPDL
jgi:hypothetical protein